MCTLSDRMVPDDTVTFI